MLERWPRRCTLKITTLFARLNVTSSVARTTMSWAGKQIFGPQL